VVKTILLSPLRIFQSVFGGPPGGGAEFEIVLLDHGLYRDLSPSFRLDYAQMWMSILQGDEKGIEHFSERLCTPSSPPSSPPGARSSARAPLVLSNGVVPHQLFACILTQRPWASVTGEELSAPPSEADFNTLRGAAPLYLPAVAKLLRALPSQLLLVVKTNDLLRSLDRILGADSVPQTNPYIVMLSHAAWLVAKTKSREARSWAAVTDAMRAWSYFVAIICARWAHFGYIVAAGWMPSRRSTLILA
jgi:aarF domain-containing kinase